MCPLSGPQGGWGRVLCGGRVIQPGGEFGGVIYHVIYHPTPASDYDLKTGHFEELSVRLEVLPANVWLQERFDDRAPHERHHRECGKYVYDSLGRLVTAKSHSATIEWYFCWASGDSWRPR